MTCIKIETSWNGIHGLAECFAAGKTFSEMGRTQVEALSRTCAALAKEKSLVGASWEAPACGMRGVVGDKITKGRRRKSISEMSTFEPVGGMMHGGSHEN